MADSMSDLRQENEPMSRRDFLRFLAASGAAVTAGPLAGCDSLGELWQRQPVIEVDEWTRGACRFCGAGCSMEIGTRDGEVVDVRGDKEGWNRGNLCIKGIVNRDILYAEDRLHYPMVRRNGDLVEVSWEEAMDEVERGFRRAIEDHGPRSVAFYGSGQLATEESYVMNKLFKAGIGSNHVEGNPRLCMASAVTGYVSTFGADEPMGSYEDIDHADCFFMTGTNAKECHPVLWDRIERRREEDPSVDLIVVDPRRTDMAQQADLHLPIKPGADVSLHMSMMQVFVEQDWVDEEMLDEYVKFRTPEDRVGYEEFRRHLQDYTPEQVSDRTGLEPRAIRRAAERFAGAGATMSMWTMGLNQQQQGTAANRSVSAMHLLTGQIGRPGATPFSITGQPNAGGGVRDTGALSHALPNGRLIANEADRREMEELWNVPEGSIHPEPGYHTVELFEAMVMGDVRACLISTTNPAQSMPNASVAQEGLRTAFTVVLDAFHPTQTTRRADVVLPAAMWAEKGGVFSQSERRYHLVPQLVEPPGEARPDLEIFLEFADRLGYGDILPNRSREEIWNEWRTISAHSYYNFEGITYERLRNEPGIRWPCPDEDHPGTSRRYVPGEDPISDASPDRRLDFYAQEDGRAAIWLDDQAPPAEETGEDYPLVLTTGRILEHWHTMTITGGVEALQDIHPDYLELHPFDARGRGIEQDDSVVVESRRGQVEFRARLTRKVAPGLVYANFHSARHLVNRVTNDAVDPMSREPDYKRCAVEVRQA